MAIVSYRYFHSFRIFNDSGEDVTSITPANDTYVGVLNIIPDDLDTLVQKAVIAQAEGDLPRGSIEDHPLIRQSFTQRAVPEVLHRHGVDPV